MFELGLHPEYNWETAWASESFAFFYNIKRARHVMSIPCNIPVFVTTRASTPTTGTSRPASLSTTRVTIPAVTTLRPTIRPTLGQILSTRGTYMVKTNRS